MYAICLGEDVFAAMDGRLRAHFPSMAYFSAVDCRLGLRTAADFARLRFPVTNAVMFNILLGRSQKQDQDIVTPGPVGVAQSHLSIWADNAGRAGWIIVFESDAAVGSGFGADIADIVRTPMVEPFPGVLKLGWVPHPRSGIRSVSVSPFVNLVLNGMQFGMQAYAIRCDALGAYVRLLAPISGHIDHEITDLAVAGVTPPLWVTVRNTCTQVNTSRGSIHPGFTFRLLLPESNGAANALLLLPWMLLLVAIVAASVVGATCRK